MGQSSFGAALRQLRLQRGLSLAELSELVHYSKGYLSRVETSMRTPTAALARSCDEALHAAGALSDLISAQTTARSEDAAAASPVTTVPRQLPAAPPHFVGRAAALTALDETAGEADEAGAVVVWAIGGMAGIGKTTLALFFAHRVAEQFPDGQLYVNLRGFDPSDAPVAPSSVIRGFLDAMGIPSARIPGDLDAQAALYRTVLADQRVLIVADNACDAEQVRPLLPGTPGCLVLITSRNQLASLAVTSGARMLDLDVLTVAEAGALLTSRIGSVQVTAEPEVLTGIIARCGRLPLALAIVAARAAARPAAPLSALAAELDDGLGPFETLRCGDDPRADLRAVFSWSYRQLGHPAARLFRLLGIHHGADITVAGCASLAGVTVSQARGLVAELTGAHLMSEPIHGRYALHDLVREYAGQAARAEETAELRAAAAQRILDHYLQSAAAATWLVDSAREQLRPIAPAKAVTLERPADRAQALAWLAAEHLNLLAAVRQAASAGLDIHAWQLAWILWTHLAWQGHWHDLVAVQTVAVAAASRLGDMKAQALTRRALAESYARLGRHDDARAQYLRALALSRQAADPQGQGLTLSKLVKEAAQAGDYGQALDYAYRALALLGLAGDLRGQANAMNSIGFLRAELGDYPHALTYCRRAHVLQVQIGDTELQAHTWDSLGYIHGRLGECDQAIACYQRGIALLADLGDRPSQATMLSDLGATCYRMGQFDDARCAWQQALAIFSDLGHPDVAQLRARLDGLDNQGR